MCTLESHAAIKFSTRWQAAPIHGVQRDDEGEVELVYKQCPDGCGSTLSEEAGADVVRAPMARRTT